MQFKHPELLYGLFLLLIPIIVHLFQLRKFQKESFTNVAFLKQVTLQTRRSSQIKKWLVLLTRMGILAAVVTAFAQPYTSKNKTFNSKTETVVFLDNSFSMQAKGNKGELLKRAVQDLISNVPKDENFTLITNNDVYRNTTIKAITNDLLQLKNSTNQTPYEAATLKSKKFFSKNKNTIKNLMFISDFQQKNNGFTPVKDSTILTNLVQLKPINTNNIAIDSAYISKRNNNTIELTVQLSNSGTKLDNLPVSLFNNGNLLSKTSVSITDETKTVFSLPNNTLINGEITIDDTSLQFDNRLYFNINKTNKINVLAISEASDSFLKRIYTNGEFNYKNTQLNQLNYSDITNQNLVVLNELPKIPSSLLTALQNFTKNGGVLIIVPSEVVDLKSYNSFLVNNQFNKFETLNKSEKRLTTINYSHPLYNDGVFEKRITNFQYPKNKSYYSQEIGNASAALQFEDGKPFLLENNNVFVFTSALNKNNSNFQDVNLIVPTFYNISKRSLKLSNLFYTIGKENTFDVSTSLQQDAILTIVNNENKIIPQQHYFNNKVAITTTETPENAGIYQVKNKTEIIENISYNYNRSESDLKYYSFSNLDNVTVSNSISQVFNTIKNDNKVNALWKWFVIFALVLLIIEMLILKYFK